MSQCPATAAADKKSEPEVFEWDLDEELAKQENPEKAKDDLLDALRRPLRRPGGENRKG